MPSTSWSGRPPVRRCVLAAAVLLGALSVPAAHADGDPAVSAMPTCPTEGSVTVFDDSVHDQRTRVALYSPAFGETDVCYQTMNSVQFVLALISSTDGVRPTTTVVAGSGGCAGQIVRTGSPVDMEIGFDPATQSVCYGNSGATTTVTVTPAPGGPVPHLSLWLPANSALNQWGWCTTHWLKWKSGFHSAKAAWQACYQQDNQVL
jgi:hypothetical protein